ncbi:DUF87 domain-containing protein [Candidatus Woesearchaeota archaeon]|nr:DUF87 domain-containing protein [Candidatus Woesearchaeota archaeon]
MKKEVGLVAGIILLLLTSLQTSFYTSDVDFNGSSIYLHNTQSYPVKGHNWIIAFDTLGIDNLTFSGIDTVFDLDLRVDALYCGLEERSDLLNLVNSNYVISSWDCDVTTFLVVKELTSGKHHIRIQYGTDYVIASNAAAEANQDGDLLNLYNLTVPFIQDHFTDSETQKIFVVSGTLDQTVNFYMPEESDSVVAGFNIAGTVSTSIQGENTNIYSISAGNVTNQTSIVTGLDGVLEIYGYNDSTSEWYINHTIESADIFSNVLVGEFNTSFPLDEVVYTSQNSIYVVRATNAGIYAEWNDTPSMNDIIDVELMQTDGDALNELAVVTDNSLFIYDDDGTLLNSALGFANGIKDVACGNVDASANDEIIVVSTGDDVTRVYDYQAGFLRSVPVTNPYSVAVGELNGGSSLNEIAVVNGSSISIMSNNLIKLNSVSYDITSRASKLLISDVMSTSAGNELVAGFSGGGGLAGHFVIYSTGLGILWDYDTGAGAVMDMLSYDVNSQSGNELIVADDAKAWYIQNGNNYPQDVSVYVGADLIFENPGIFSSNESFFFSGNLSEYLSTCSNLCSVPIRVTASNYGQISVGFSVDYVYNLTGVLDYAIESSFYSFDNITANVSYPYEHARIFYNDQIYDNLLFNYLAMDWTASSCFFNGRFYSNYTDTLNMCDITTNPYVVLGNGTTPPNAYYWTSDYKSCYQSYYTTSSSSSASETNITYTLTSNVSSALTNTILEFNLTNLGNINNDTLYYKSGLTLYDITPLIIDRESCNSPSPDFDVFNHDGRTFGTCFEDTDDNTIVDFVKIRLNSLAAASSIQYYVHRFNNYFPYLTNVYLEDYNPPWGENITFNVTIADAESDLINVSLYLRTPGSSTFSRYDWKQIAAGANASFDVIVQSSWIGMVEYYFNYTDGYHPRIISSNYNDFIVRKHYASVEYFYGNNSNVNRSGTAKTKLSVRIFDLDTSSYVSEGVLGRPYVGASSFSLTATNLTGYLSLDFDPGFSFTPGPTSWYFALQDSSYFANQSSLFNVNVWGTIFTIPSNPTLSPVSGGDVGRQISSEYPNEINWTFLQVIDDYGFNLGGSVNFTVYWRDVIVNDTPNCNDFIGGFTIPPATPMFMDDDYLSFWINRTWYNSYHYTSADYIVHDSINFTYDYPPNNTIVYRTASLLPNQITFSVHLTMDSGDVEGQNLLIQTDLGQCTPVINYTGGIYNCTYNPADTSIPGNYSWWAEIDNGGGNIERAQINGTFLIHSIVNISEMDPEDSGSVYGLSADLYCNVTDYDLPKISAQSPIYNKTVYFYNDTDLIGSSNTNASGIAHIIWDISSITADQLINITCNTTTEPLKFNTVFGGISSITHEVRVDLFEQLFIESLLPNGTSVGRVNVSGYPEFANLSVHVTDSDGSNITNATIYFDVFGDSDDDCITGVVEVGNGTYYCLYDPKDDLVPGVYNWSAKAVKEFKLNSSWSENHTLNIKAFGSLDFVSKDLVFARSANADLFARLLDYSSQPILSSFGCDWYIDGIYNGTTGMNSTGYCNYTWMTDTSCYSELPSGDYNVTVFLAWADSDFYVLKNNDTGNITLEDSSFNLNIVSPLQNVRKYRTDDVWLNVSVQDSCFNDIVVFDVDWYYYSSSDMMNHSIVSLSNQDSYFWNINDSILLGPSMIYANVTVPSITSIVDNVSVSVWGWGKIFGATDIPALGTYMEGDIVTLRCNVTDANVSISELGYNLTGYNVNFYVDGIHMFTNVSQNGVAYYNWNTSGNISADANYNLTCGLNFNSGLFYNRSNVLSEQNSSVIVYVDMLDPMDVNLTSPENNTMVSTYNDSYYYPTVINLTADVFDGLNPILNADITWNIPAGSCLTEINHSNGTYSCLYQPSLVLVPGTYNWSVYAEAFGKVGVLSENRTIDLMGLVKLEANTSYILRNEISPIVANLIDWKNNSLDFAGYNCTFYLDDKYLGWNITNATGDCLISNDVRGNCSFNLGELELKTFITGSSPYWNSSYYNVTQNITVKDSNITITFLSPLDDSINYRTGNILMNATAVDSCGPVIGSTFTWYDDYVLLNVGNNFYFDSSAEPLGDHNLTLQVSGPNYVSYNDTINYSIWTYSKVYFVGPATNNFGLGYPVEILCGVNTSDTNQVISNYLVTLKEEAAVVGSSLTNGSGVARFIWTPSVPGLRSLFCEISTSKPYTPSLASVLKVANVTDIDPPVIISANVTPLQGYVNYFTFDLDARVSDLSNVSQVWFRFNNSYHDQNVTLVTRVTVNATTYDFSALFVPSFGGVFDVYVYSNDSSGNTGHQLVGIVNILNSTYVNLTIDPFQNMTLNNLTRSNRYEFPIAFNATNIGLTPMFNTSFIFSIPKGVQINVTNSKAEFLNAISTTVPADFETFNITYTNYSISCGDILASGNCFGLSNYKIYPNATIGNNTIKIYFRWMNPSNEYVVVSQEFLIDVLNNTVVHSDTDEINALITPGHDEVISNFTIEAFGTTPLENITLTIIPQTSPPTLMSLDWFNITAFGNLSHLGKLSDMIVNLTMNIPSSNYTYEFLNYHYPATSWDYEFTLLVNVSNNSNYCRYSSACSIEIPITVVVGASKWSIVDGGIVTEEHISRKIAYNQTAFLGYIPVYNYQTQSTGNIPFTILNLPNTNSTINTSDFLFFQNTSAIALKSSETRIPVYYATNETVGNFTGYIVFDAVSDTITPNQLNISVDLEVVPFGVFLDYPTEISPYRDLYAGDLLNAKARVYYNGLPLSDNVYFVLNVSGEPSEIILSSYNASDEIWYFQFAAPEIEHNPISNYLKFTAIYNNVEAFAFENNSLIYVDVIPPWFEDPYADFIEPGENMNLRVKIFDNVQVNETYINLTHLNASGANVTERYNLTYQGDDTYSVQLFNMVSGDYRVKFIAYDNYSTNESVLNGSDIRHMGTYNWWFGVYNKTRIFGKVNDRVGHGYKGNMILSNPYHVDETLFEVPMDDFGSYDEIVHRRNYSLTLNSSIDLKIYLMLRNVDLYNVSNVFDFIDVDMKDDVNGYTIDDRKVYKVYGFDSPFNSLAGIYIDYSDVVVDDINKMFLYQCNLWDFNNESCLGTWTKIDQRSYVNIDGNTYFYSPFNFTSQSAIALVHDVPPIDQNNFISMNTQTSSGQINPSVLKKVLEEKLNESRQEILNETHSIIDPYLDSLSTFEEFNKKYGLNFEDITRMLYQGENLSIPLFLKNSQGVDLQVKLGYSDSLSDFFTINTSEFTLKAMRESQLLLKLHIPKDYPTGVYNGNFEIVVGSDAIRLPVSLRVIEQDSLQLQMFVKLLGDYVVLGKNLGLDIELYNPSDEMKNVSLGFEVYDMNNNLLYEISNLIDLNTYYNNVSLLSIPQNLSEGEYYVKTKISYALNGFVKEFSRVNRFEIVNPLLYREIYGVPIWVILSFILLITVVLGGVKVQQVVVEKSRRYHLPVFFKELPLVKTESRVPLGKLSEYEKEVFFDVDNLMTHTIIAGSTGGGKTVAAQGVVEHALDKNIGVVVFDPTAQWTGFFRKNDDNGMFNYYSKFGLRRKDARSYPGTIVVIEDALQKIDLKKHMNPGEITVFSLHKLEPREIDIFVASTVKQVFSQGLDEDSHLKNLMVYDEVHRLLPKFGGSGAGFVQIERACREFRKWGIGLVLISQVLSDFVGEIKANINTEVQMRTKDEADLQRLKTKYGEDVLRSVVKAETGNGMMNNPAYNKGKPFMVNFRPLLHSPRRLKEADLEKYIGYSNKLEEIIHNVGLLEKHEVDVFDFNLEIKLAKEKLASGSFTMVDMYLEGLTSRLDESLQAHGLTREKVPIEKIDMDELRDDIERARKAHGGSIGVKKVEKVESSGSSNYYNKFLDKLEGTKETSSVNLSKISEFSDIEVSKPKSSSRKSSIDIPVIKETPSKTKEDDVNTQYSNFQSRVDNLKRSGVNTKMLELNMKYISSDINALQKNYIDRYYTNAQEKLKNIETDIIAAEHILNMRDTVKGYIKKGISESQIRQKLKSQKWPEDSIDEIFKLL